MFPDGNESELQLFRGFIMLRVGIDTGGTFTDFIFYQDGEIHIMKIPSTPKNPAEAVLSGLNQWKGSPDGRQVIHGSTIATNTLLERKGAKTALITTMGFEDVLEIGRQTRSQLYNLFVRKTRPLVPGKLRFGVEERTLHTGETLKKLDVASVQDMVRKLKEEDVESIAICLLFSYANPHNELALLQGLKEMEIPVSVSHRILPEYREYERCSTTVVNAYVYPIVERYISYLETRITDGRLSIMQSNGGYISAKRAKEEPIRTVLSGPAAGVVGAFEIAKASGYSNIITLDMGGTSTDVSLCNAGLGITTESEISGVPVKVPMINIHTVGAGGGSIAHIDEGGSLRVGPQSAGADPGPVCYCRADNLTVTDANLYLGRLVPGYFLGGDRALCLDNAKKAFKKLASSLCISTQKTADGIIDVANATMEGAIRVVSMEKGYDPREFTLVSFGGAGGLHACALARGLSIPRVLIPKNPGLLSAYGMLLADVVKDYSQSVLIRIDELKTEEIDALFKPLIERGMDEMSREKISVGSLLLEKCVDMRYVGQSYEILVPFNEAYVARFNELHETVYGYSDEKRPYEIVNLRVRMVGGVSKPSLKKGRSKGESPASALVGQERVVYRGESIPFDLYLRERLCPGNRLEGPAILVEYSSTLFLPPDFTCDVDLYGNLILSPY